MDLTTRSQLYSGYLASPEEVPLPRRPVIANTCTVRVVIENEGIRNVGYYDVADRVRAAIRLTRRRLVLGARRST